jgi:hypothetical protein
MLKTSGQESNDIYNGDAVCFNWKLKSFVADPDLPIDTLIDGVNYVSVNVSDDKSKEIDASIKLIVKNDDLITKITNISNIEKDKLDKILSERVKMTRKSNKLMDYLREKFDTVSLPFKTVIFGNKYKATKSRGSESIKPDYAKIVAALKVKFPKIVKDIELLEKTITKTNSTASRWSNFSEIHSDK